MQHIPRLANECIASCGCGAGQGWAPSIFVDDTSPTNIFLYSSVSRNIKNYIHRCYITQYIHWLTEEFIIYSSLLQVYSSVVTNEYIVDSCSKSQILIRLYLYLESWILLYPKPDSPVFAALAWISSIFCSLIPFSPFPCLITPWIIKY
jgi:hypothetical protein